MKNLILLIGAILLVSCSTEGVENREDKVAENSDVKTVEDKGEYKAEPSVDSKSYPGGLVVNWKLKGEGKQITTGDVVNIVYEVRLKDNSIVESSAKLGLKTYPFMVGFGMQTEGWDIALKDLKIGDSVEVLMPSKLARGEKGYKERDKYSGEIREIIPPNSDLIVILKAESLEPPIREIDGNKVWRLLENGNKNVLFDEGKTIDFHCMVSTPTNPMYVNTFMNKPPFSLKLEDSGVVPGLKKALIGSKEGDRLYVYVPADQGYKNKGYQDLVKPNEPLFYNVMVMNVK